MNKCDNCKFINFSGLDCRHTFVFDISDGMYIKQYKRASDIRNGADDCPYYKPSWFMKQKLRFGKIQRWWYSKTYPQKLI